MHIAVLGTTEIRTHTLTAFESNYGSEYVEHPLIGVKPRIQYVGDRLDEHNLTFQLHHLFCDVDAEIENLQQAKKDHRALAYVSGAGVHYGHFVITTLTLNRKHADDKGNILLAELNVTLKEYVGKNGLPLPPAIAQSLTKLPTVKNPLGNVLGNAKFAAAMQTVKRLSTQVTAGIKAVQTVRSMMSKNPLAVLSRLPTVVGDLSKIVPDLGLSAEHLALFEQYAPIANDVGLVGKSLYHIQNKTSDLVNALSTANLNNLEAVFQTAGNLGTQITQEQSKSAAPLARLSASSVLRQHWW